MGIGNAVCRQLRCISLLTLPMYCGKPGRGVLKAVVLTYVIAGPITNMGLNAKEVVRVYACSTHLAYNLSRTKYNLMVEPFQKSVFMLKDDMELVKDTLGGTYIAKEVVRVYACSTHLAYNLSRTKYNLMVEPVQKSVFMLKDDMELVKDTLGSFRKVAAPIEDEVENLQEVNMSRLINDYVDGVFDSLRRSDQIEKKYAPKPSDKEETTYHKTYAKKLEYRCQEQISRAIKLCFDAFHGAFDNCVKEMPAYAAWAMCWPLKITYICNLMHYIDGAELCDSSKEYIIHLVNIFVALLFIRIIRAAISYHDKYLTSIGYDNVYVTSYFKKIDRRRVEGDKCSLLPLKKMERSKYIDVRSTEYTAERNKLLTKVLKVLLEVVTATTFVMLDRLFYEALDVVRQHAEADVTQQGEHDVKIKVDGKGVLANAVRTLLSGLNGSHRVRRTVSNHECLPRPRSMPVIYFLKIYGGYLWILLLLYFNPYTKRLNRLICSWFYPRREKQRILHLYNDILKKRVKMEKTLRRTAVQAVRAYYLSGENLLSLRMKFPHVLGWLQVLPPARMTCLICGETEPRNADERAGWHTCTSAECPFVYCSECWHEIGQRCLACDPSLAELSDVDSLSEDDQPRY
ncbi:DC-STAMP-like protein domain-containing protein [Phthorimaea operculella]|nr:DC-STAMP-like protein domain-containing protein [Phthorimaea operculella]